jgi:hypothetical protein
MVTIDEMNHAGLNFAPDAHAMLSRPGLTFLTRDIIFKLDY